MYIIVGVLSKARVGGVNTRTHAYKKFFYLSAKDFRVQENFILRIIPMSIYRSHHNIFFHILILILHVFVQVLIFITSPGSLQKQAHHIRS